MLFRSRKAYRKELGKQIVHLFNLHRQGSDPTDFEVTYHLSRATSLETLAYLTASIILQAITDGASSIEFRLDEHELLYTVAEEQHEMVALPTIIMVDMVRELVRCARFMNRDVGELCVPINGACIELRIHLDHDHGGNLRLTGLQLPSRLAD